MNPFAILAKHYDPTSELYRLLVTHSLLVARKARQIATAYQKANPEAEVDVDFVTEAAMLHDIGIQGCNAPKIHCVGEAPYVRHGVLGRAILESEGLPRHALVCERHTGAGMTREDVELQGLPLEPRDYLPVSLEEKIICVADKFYSKKPRRLWKAKSLEAIKSKLSKFGPEADARWKKLIDEVL
jgi:uncharacterized protein